MNLAYRIGSLIRVQLYNGQTVTGTVCAFFDTTAGRKVRIVRGCVVNNLDWTQGVDVITY